MQYHVFLTSLSTLLLLLYLHYCCLSLPIIPWLQMLSASSMEKEQTPIKASDVKQSPQLEKLNRWSRTSAWHYTSDFFLSTVWTQKFLTLKKQTPPPTLPQQKWSIAAYNDSIKKPVLHVKASSMLTLSKHVYFSPQIIIIINLIYIAQFDTNSILTALYIVI